MQRLKEIAFLLQKRSSSQISLVLRAIVRRSMVPRQRRCARVLVSRQVVWPLEHSRVSPSFLTNFQALICTSSAKCLTGRSSCFAARQPNAKAHGVKQSKSLVVTQYAEPLLPTSGENQNR